MTNPELDLLGDPIPEPLAENERLTSWDSLKGHTILAVIDTCVGQRHADVVIVTATKCWLPIMAESDGYGDDDAYVQIADKHRNYPEPTLHDYVSADTLHSYGCITDSERTHLRGVEAERKQKEAVERAGRLRAQADRELRDAGIAPA